MRTGRLVLALMLLIVVSSTTEVQYIYITHLPQFGHFTGKGATGAYSGAGSCANLSAVGVSWTHNWTLDSLTRCPGVDSVPMIATAVTSRDILDGRAILPDGYRMQLWNEPDLILPISPEEAAHLFRELEPLLLEYNSLVAPVPSEIDTNWLRKWVAAYNSLYGERPRFDIVAFHCYAQRADKCIALGQQAVAWCKEWGCSEVWCTEFGFWFFDWKTEATRFVAWMKAEPMVTRWAWWSLHSGPAPLTQDDVLTKFGQWYATQ